jgi:hypothetical protein
MMAVALLWLSLPRGLAGIAGLEGDAILQDLRLRGGNGTPEILADAAAPLERRLFWHDTGLANIDYGVLLFRQSQQMADPAAQRQRQETALLHIEQGLAQAPGNPSAWAQLARIRALKGDSRGAAAALRLSMLTGAVTPAIMEGRLALGLYLLEALDLETRDMLAAQVRLLWTARPDIVAALPTAQAGRDFLRETLAALSSEDEARYTSLVARHR